MRIEYETTLADLKEWHRFSMSRPRVRHYVMEQRCWKAAFIAFGIFIILFAKLGEFSKATGIAGGTFAVLVLSMWFIDTRQFSALCNGRSPAIQRSSGSASVRSRSVMIRSRNPATCTASPSSGR